MSSIQVNGETKSFNHASVLIFLEENHVPQESHCKNGFCGMCRRKVKNPEAVEHSDDAIAFIPHGHILPCACKVKEGQTLELE